MFSGDVAGRTKTSRLLAAISVMPLDAGVVRGMQTESIEGLRSPEDKGVDVAARMGIRFSIECSKYWQTSALLKSSSFKKKCCYEISKPLESGGISEEWFSFVGTLRVNTRKKSRVNDHP